MIATLDRPPRQWRDRRSAVRAICVSLLLVGVSALPVRGAQPDGLEPRAAGQASPAPETSATPRASGSASQASAGATDEGQTPTFRSSVELVPVDVAVVDKDGNPVESLGADDFQLEIDGRPRALRSVEFVKQKTASSRRTGAQLPQAYSSNDASDLGRLIMLVIDEQSFSVGEAQQVLRTARDFIDRLNPSDQVGLVAFPGAGPVIDFTTNHKVVRDALGRVTGKAESLDLEVDLGLAEAISIDRGELGAVQNVVQRECAQTDAICVERVERQARTLANYYGQQARVSMTALRGIFSSLRTVEGTKSVILLSGGLVSTDLQNDVQELGSLALAAQVSIFVMQLDLARFDASRPRPSPTPGADDLARAQGLQTLAGLGRGGLFKVLGTGEYAFTRVLREISGYYLLTFEPDQRERDGKRHRIKVELARKGFTVRARSEFTSEVDTSTKNDTQRLQALLRAPLASTKLPIRVTTYTYQETRGSRVRTYVCATLDTVANETVPAQIGYLITNEKGRVVANAMEQVSATLYVASVLLEPGAYRLKLAALDIEGRQGSVEHRFSATVASAGNLRIGDLMLAEAGERPGQFPRPSIDQPRSGLAIGYLEFYSDQRQNLASASVMFEVADTPEGEALLSVADTGLGISGRRRAAQGLLQVRLLPPGEYVLRARVTNGTRQLRTVMRPFRVTREGALSLVANSSDAMRLRPEFRAFDKADPLRDDVVGYFLGQLENFPSAHSDSLAESLALARAGKFSDAAGRSSGDAPPKKMVSAFMRGLDQYAKGAYDKAIGEFQASVAVASDFFPALVYIGASLAAAGRDGDAVAAWQTSLSIDNEVAPTFPLLADALVRLNDGEQAAAVLQEARELWPEDVRFEGMLAHAYAMMGKQEESYELLEDYLAKRPDDLDAEFLAMRLLYEAYMDGRTFDSTLADRQRLKQYASTYMSAGGTQTPIVSKWLTFLEQEIGSQP